MKTKNTCKILISLIFSSIALSSCGDNENILNKSLDKSNFRSETINQQTNNNISTDVQSEKDRVIYFDFDKCNINKEFSEILDKHAAFIIQHPNCKIVIEGYTDERGTPSYNLLLGERRANAVKLYLQNKGCSSSQISIISYGEDRPVSTGHDEISYAKNRRAVIVY